MKFNITLNCLFPKSGKHVIEPCVNFERMIENVRTFPLAHFCSLFKGLKSDG